MNASIWVFAQFMGVIVATAASITIILNWGSRREPRRGELHHDEHRLQRLETSVDAIAIEVERISEAQRFMARRLDESLPVRRAEHLGELMDPGKRGRVDTPH